MKPVVAAMAQHVHPLRIIPSVAGLIIGERGILESGGAACLARKLIRNCFIESYLYCTATQ
jgi:hypothetical protein